MEPIQAIRRVHDREVRRRMPHVTLPYPFVPCAELERAAVIAQEALSPAAPLELTLPRFDVFRHGGGTYTVWLAPEPREAISDVQRTLLRAFPRCDG